LTFLFFCIKKSKIQRGIEDKGVEGCGRLFLFSIIQKGIIKKGVRDLAPFFMNHLKKGGEIKCHSPNPIVVRRPLLEIAWSLLQFQESVSLVLTVALALVK
jgi:hypothetical protein